MFITITRLGGGRSLRVAIAAIAYVDEAAEGAIVKLIGGEGLRAHETREEIEAMLDAQAPIFAEAIVGGLATAREMVAGDIMPNPIGPKPRGKRR